MNGADRPDSPPGPSQPLPLPAPPRSITWRSVLLGSAAVCLVSLLGPYNDYVVANSFLVGSYFPPVLAGLFFVLVILVNGPLHWLRPRWALSAGELAIVMVMLLVACSIPGQGLMRNFMPTPAAPFYHGNFDDRFWQAFVDMQLPAWLFPVEDIEEGRQSTVIAFMYARVPADTPIPWSAWIVPLLGWGVFIFGMFATLVALASLLRYQWAVNERLPFPLVQLKLALIEPPQPGRVLNRLFSSWAFWIGLAAVFAIQSMVGLHAYFPRTVPEFPTSFDLQGVLSNEPWVYLHHSVKAATIYFTFIWVAYFIQSRVSFSLWAIFLIERLISMHVQTYGGDISVRAWRDQHLGAAVAFLIGVMWIGRHHWMAIFRQCLGRARPGEQTGEYGSYRLMLFIAVAGVAIMLLWLILLGVQPWVASLIVSFILLGHLVITRVVAETGLPFMRMYATASQVMDSLPPQAFNSKDVFFSGVFTLNAGAYVTRESLTTFAMHGMSVNESASNPTPRQRWGVLGLIAAALVLGFVMSSISSLWCYYNYSTALPADSPHAMLNHGGMDVWPRVEVNNRVVQHQDGRFPPTPHNVWGHMLAGAGITGLLQAAAWRWTWWPFMPVGYLLAPTWYLEVSWFSIFLGWLAKVLILKYGGAVLFQQARPLFVGIIFGEALAMGAWLLITLYLASQGYEYHVMTFLPQ
jgi:hypothetical protein